MKVGDLIRMNFSGLYATVIRETYTHRFMDPDDLDMVDAGMGHLAGRYGAAFDVRFHGSGYTKRIATSDRNFVLISVSYQ